MKIKVTVLLVLSSFVIVACSEKDTSKKTVKTIERNVDPVQYSRGQKLYLQNCAVCHGKHGEGAPNWQKPDAAGKYPAPPLNGTAHTWHHSTRVLVDTIKNGTAKLGGNMPAWKDKLSDQDIADILSWIKAQWPDEIYTAWYNRFHQQK